MNIVDIFIYQNPWRTNKDFKVRPYFNRLVLPKIEKWITEPEIIVLIGPRQSGKTTILYKIIENQINQNKSSDSILFFNCDNLAVQNLFENITDFLQFLRQMTVSSFPFIIIDEIQRLSNPIIFLKQLYDLKLNNKIIVSGSSSLEIRSKIKETLTGRKIIFNILQLNFEEILVKDSTFAPLLQIHGDEILRNFYQFERIWGTKLRSEIEQYLLYGGYPRVLLTTIIEKKKQILSEIFTSYIQKDISDFLKIENISGFNKLIQVLALTSGQIINMSNIGLKSGIAHQTLNKYLQILRETFIVDAVIPYFSNKLKEIIKNPKLYFFDPGIRNFAISNFNPTQIRPDHGLLLESFVFRELKSYINNKNKLKFWRTKVGAEVDFILEKGENLLPIECKSFLKQPKCSRSFQNFLKLYQPFSGLVINNNLFDKINFESSKIYFIPYHWFSILNKFLFF